MSATSPAAEHAQRPKKKRGYLLPGAIALAALLVIAVAAGAGDLFHSAPTSLHGSDVASEIALGLQVQERSSAPPSVRCPDSEPVRQGVTFDCTVDRGGSTQSVVVVEIDSRGHLRWSLQPAGS